MAEKKAKKKEVLKKNRTPDFRIVYSNGVTIVNTARDFQIMFGIIMMGLDGKFEVNEHTSVIISPQHAKALLSLLDNRIKDWEKSHGEIKIIDPSP